MNVRGHEVKNYETGTISNLFFFLVSSSIHWAYLPKDRKFKEEKIQVVNEVKLDK